MKGINIKNAHRNNLKNIDAFIPYHQLTVITGVSGSGKSTLASEILAKAGSNQFLTTLPSFVRDHIGKIEKVEVDEITGLPPTIEINQKVSISNGKSTVGTVTEIYDYLRVLFSRFGEHPANLKFSKSSFSFHTEDGKCPSCNGIGHIEFIDETKLVKDCEKSIAEGCLAPTLPTGYIMYSQVTIDVLKEVCNAEGFDIHTKWKDLSRANQEVILYGSEKIKVPFGKHSIESRMNWTGIKAKPREKGYYRGLVPIMSEILKRDRNPNILKYTSNQQCKECNGSKIKKEANEVHLHQKSIFNLSQLTFIELLEWLNSIQWKKECIPLIAVIKKKTALLVNLGIGELSCEISAKKLEANQLQRIRLSHILETELSQQLIVIDEPTVGLNKKESENILKYIQNLCDKGNTVVVVEHNLTVINAADWIIEIGPEGGHKGGQMIYQGPPKKVENKNIPSLSTIPNLEVISGGNSTQRRQLFKDRKEAIKEFQIEIHVSQKAIGKNARSTPATYLKIADQLRNLYAKQSQKDGSALSRSSFSFNTKEGCCLKCGGSGKLELGLHFLGQIESECPECQGARFTKEVLKVKWNALNLAEIYEKSVEEALILFNQEPAIKKPLQLLCDFGLGYLQLGQSSTTLSGGEAQRIKLISQLQSLKKEKALISMEYPTLGLHQKDIIKFIQVLKNLGNQGHQLLILEENELIHSCAEKHTSLRLREYYFEQEKYVPTTSISFKNISTFNLKNLDVSIPYNKITSITGPSGAGKTALTYHTLHQTSQKYFLANLSTYSRSFIKNSFNAEFESFNGLTVTRHLGEVSRINHPYSTVATVLGVHEYLRILFSRNNDGKIPAKHFSFQNPNGACATCSGKGIITQPDWNRCLKNGALPLPDALVKNSVLEYYTDPGSQFMAIFKKVAELHHIDLNAPWNSWSKEHQKLFLNGTGEEAYSVNWEYGNTSRKGSTKIEKPWLGILQLLEQEFAITKDHKNNQKILKLTAQKCCPSCKGKRYNQKILQHKVLQRDISQVLEMEIDEFIHFLCQLDTNKLQRYIAQKLLPIARSVQKLALGHLQLSRNSSTLSNGEWKRLSLVALANNKSAGTTYILDEPSQGLDSNNVKNIKSLLDQLIESGNTVILNDHNRNLIQQTDHEIALGPKSGNQGGSIEYKGAPRKIGIRDKIKVQNSRGKKLVSFKKANAIHLKDIDIDIYQGIHLIKGVSGSGKSTLLNKVIQPSLEKKAAVNCEQICIHEPYHQILTLQNFSFQSTVGQLLKIEQFLTQQFAKVSGLKSSTFKKGNKDGKCPECMGKGKFEYTLDYLESSFSPCLTCQETGFNDTVLGLKLQGNNIHEWNKKSLKEFCNSFPEKQSELLAISQNLGISDLLLQSQIGKLSAGQRNRVLLQTSLIQNKKESIMLLDEPSIGLDSEQVKNLVFVLQQKAKEGMNFIIVDHNEIFEEIATSQTTLGPEAGQKGGYILG